MFTPKHKAILTLLSDGKRHDFTDVMKCLQYSDDEQSIMFVQVSTLRKALEPFGQTIICESDGNGVRGYRHVTPITPNTSALTLAERGRLKMED